MTAFPTEFRRALLERGIEKTVVLSGYTHHYWDQGEGAPLLLLSGFGGSAYDWRFLRQDLVSSGFRVLALEFLGSGYSDKPAAADYSVPAQARRVAEFLETLGIERARVMAASYGGGLALRLTLDRPDLVERLILLDAASMPQSYPYHVRILRTPVLSGIAANVPPKTYLVRGLLKEIYFDDSKIRKEDILEYAHELRLPGAMQALRHIARSLDVAAIAAWSEEYGRISIPALILWGEEDTLTPLEVGKALHGRLPRSAFVSFPRCGHCPHMEIPRETWKEIEGFLRMGGEIERSSEPGTFVASASPGFEPPQPDGRGAPTSPS